MPRRARRRALELHRADGTREEFDPRDTPPTDREVASAKQRVADGSDLAFWAALRARWAAENNQR